MGCPFLVKYVAFITNSKDIARGFFAFILYANKIMGWRFLTAVKPKSTASDFSAKNIDMYL
jgi:hypothetical protein